MTKRLAERALDLAATLMLSEQDFAELALLCADQAGMTRRQQAALRKVFEDDLDLYPAQDKAASL